MSEKQRYIDALHRANDAGDIDSVNEIADYLEANFSDEMTIPEKIKGAVGVAGQMATGLVSDPIAGLAGIAGTVLPGEEGQGAEWVKGVKDTLSFDPSEETQKVGQAISEYIPEPGKHLGDTLFDATGSPLLGAIGQTLPTAIMEKLGMKSPQLLKKIVKGQEKLNTDEVSVIQREIDNYKPPEAPVMEQVDMAKSLAKGGEGMGAVSEFNPEVLKAADDLGAKYVPASVAAGNPQARDLYRGVESMRGTQARASYGEFIEGMSKIADDIIVNGGGDLDKAAVSQLFKEKSNRIIDAIKAEEKFHYKDIDNAIGKATEVDPVNLRALVDEKLVNAGGRVSDMPKIYQGLHKKLNDSIEGDSVSRNMTYDTFIQEMRDVGAGVGMKQSPYPDAELGTLKYIYGAIKKDQASIVDDFGVADIQKLANKLTSKRKAVENSVVDLLGKKLTKDLMPEMTARVTALPKGKVSAFKKTLEGIPNSMRESVVVSSLNDLMKGSGADQKSFGASRFYGFMSELNKSPAAKAALYKEIPKKTQKSLDSLFVLSKAIYESNKDIITTGMMNTFFPDSRSMMSKAMGKGLIATAAVKGGSTGAKAAEAAFEYMRNSSPAAIRANEFISSKNFQELIKNSVKDGVLQGDVLSRKTKNLEKVISKTKKYKEWADKLDGTSQAELKALGIVNYFMQIEGEEE